MWSLIVLFLSIYLTYKVCRILFRNTIGTTMAYATRAFVVWMIVTAIVAGIANKLGLL